MRKRPPPPPPKHTHTKKTVIKGLFHFDASYRPVPLELAFVGVTVPGIAARNAMMNEICYKKVSDSLRAGNQVMVFVHSRKDTGKTARALAELAARAGDGALFSSDDHPQRGLYTKDVRRSRNAEVGELFDSGFGIHHAGMLRPDRNLTERLFAEGLIKVCAVCGAGGRVGVAAPLFVRCLAAQQKKKPSSLPATHTPSTPQPAKHPLPQRTHPRATHAPHNRCCAARRRSRGASTCRRTRS